MLAYIAAAIISASSADIDDLALRENLVRACNSNSEFTAGTCHGYIMAAIEIQVDDIIWERCRRSVEPNLAIASVIYDLERSKIKYSFLAIHDATERDWRCSSAELLRRRMKYK